MVAACPYPTSQGTQALIGEMARVLSRRGHRIRLVCYHHKAFERQEPFIVERTRPVPAYARLRSGPDWVKPLLDMLLVHKTVQIVRDHACQLIHAHNYEGAVAGAIAAAICQVPLVYHAHNLMQDELPDYFNSDFVRKLAEFFGFFLDHSVPRLGQRVIGMHAAQVENLIELGVLPDRIHLIEPGIDTDFWRQSRYQGRDTMRIAYCGNLDDYQNLPLLFRALQSVQTQLPGVRLVLATSNSIQQARDLVTAHKVDTLVEIVPAKDALETREAYASCCLAVSPRIVRSGFPIKNLNAQACGLPVVACQGSAWGLVHNRGAQVVADNDHQAFAQAIVDLIKDPALCRKMGTMGQLRVQSRYNWQRMASQIEAVWSQALRE